MKAAPSFRRRPDPEPCPHCGDSMRWLEPEYAFVAGVPVYVGRWMCRGIGMGLRVPVTFHADGTLMHQERHPRTADDFRPLEIKIEHLTLREIALHVWHRIVRGVLPPRDNTPRPDISEVPF